MEFLGKGTRELKDGDIVNISQKLTDRKDIRSLAIGALKMEENKVEQHFANHPSNIAEAVYLILQEWLKNQPNRSEARTVLIQALHTVKLKALIELLQPNIDQD